MTSNPNQILSATLTGDDLDVKVEIPPEWIDDPIAWGWVLARIAQELSSEYRKRHPNRKLKVIQRRIVIGMNDELEIIRREKTKLS